MLKELEEWWAYQLAQLVGRVAFSVCVCERYRREQRLAGRWSTPQLRPSACVYLRTVEACDWKIMHRNEVLLKGAWCKLWVKKRQNLLLGFNSKDRNKGQTHTHTHSQENPSVWDITEHFEGNVRILAFWLMLLLRHVHISHVMLDWCLMMLKVFQWDHPRSKQLEMHSDAAATLTCTDKHTYSLGCLCIFCISNQNVCFFFLLWDHLPFSHILMVSSVQQMEQLSPQIPPERASLISSLSSLPPFISQKDSPLRWDWQNLAKDDPSSTCSICPFAARVCPHSSPPHAIRDSRKSPGTYQRNIFVEICPFQQHHHSNWSLITYPLLS